MALPAIDLTAVRRVASRVTITNIQLADLNISRHSDPKESLTPIIGSEFSVSREQQTLRVVANFTFEGRSKETLVVAGKLVYHLFYTLKDAEPTADSDLQQFANANGAYNSWPFARELLHSLTGRLGLPSYTLPLLYFPNVAPAAKEPSAERRIATSKAK